MGSDTGMETPKSKQFLPEEARMAVKPFSRESTLPPRDAFTFRPPGGPTFSRNPPSNVRRFGEGGDLTLAQGFDFKAPNGVPTSTLFGVRHQELANEDFDRGPQTLASMFNTSTASGPSVAAEEEPKPEQSRVTMTLEKEETTIPTTEEQSHPEPTAATSEPQQNRSSLRYYRSFEPACTHSTMVRIYGDNNRCHNCNRIGHFGWIYRCTQDREEIIRQKIAAGTPAQKEEVMFDNVSRTLSKLIKPRPRGPETRVDLLSFFDEATAQEIHQYTPHQMAMIIKQRRHVQEMVKKQMAQEEMDEKAELEAIRRLQDAILSAGDDETDGPAQPPAHQDDMKRELPWVPLPNQECKFQACAYCRPGGAERVNISLDGVAREDIPATAITGFGFHDWGERPVIDAIAISSLGLRPTVVISPDSDTPNEEAQGKIMKLEKGPEKAVGQLATSPARQKRSSSQASGSSNTSSRSDISRKSGIHGDKEEWTRKHMESARRPRYLPNLRPFRLETLHQDMDKQDSDLSQRDEAVNATPSPEDEKPIQASGSTAMEELERREGEFGSTPLKVEHGVAVLEESVELHVPDVITQV